MSEQNPPWALENVATGQANSARLATSASVGRAEGVVEPGGLLVAQRGAGANMSVDVSAGSCVVFGDENIAQGLYGGMLNDATKNLVISAADATNARWDLIVGKAQDSQYSGATNAWSLAVVTGTPAGSPADPAIPNNAIVLARVVVAALAASVVTANITDLRPFVATGILPVNSARRPGVVYGPYSQAPAFKPTPYNGLTVYEQDTFRFMYYDGTAWRYLGGGTQPLYAARMYNSGSFNIAGTGSTTAINLTTADYDYSSGFASNAWTAPVAGLYRVSGLWSGQITDATAQRTFLSIFKNGSEIVRGDDLTIRSGTLNDIVTFQVVDEIVLAASDVVTLRAFGATNGGGTISGAGGGTITGARLTIRRL